MPFNIFKRKYPANQPDFSILGADMHSHLLPGIDDGAPDLTTSLSLKKGLEDLGFGRFVATPHIMWDMYKNTPGTISAAVGRLNQHNIRAAAEYYFDDHVDGLLATDQPLLPIAGNKVLVEFSFVSLPIGLREKIFSMQIKGYQPILAHPERYEYLLANKSFYDELRNMGCLFQLNLLSFTGYYGRVPRELANWLVSKKYIDFLGTDLHHARHLGALRAAPQLNDAIQQIASTGLLQNSSL